MPLIWRRGLFSTDTSAAFWTSAVSEVVLYMYFSVQRYVDWIICSNWLSPQAFVLEKLRYSFSGFFRPQWSVGKLDVAPGHSSSISGRCRTWDADDIDIDLGMKFPVTISVSTLGPNSVLLSETKRQVVLQELTVPWEDRVEEALRWQVNTWQATHFAGLLSGWELGGLHSKKSLKNITNAAKKASRWLWIWKGDPQTSKAS